MAVPRRHRWHLARWRLPVTGPVRPSRLPGHRL